MMPPESVAARLELSVGAQSDPGLVRRKNEDALDYRLPDDGRVRDARGALFVVCDGIGGLEAGQYASRLAVDTFVRAYYAASESSPDVLLRAATKASNDLVYRAGRSEDRKGRMGATVVAAAIRGSELWAINVGDSRAYLWRGGALHQLSRDHSPGGRRVPDDHRIVRALGTDPQVAPFVRGPVALAAGDVLLLCTDGLTTAISDSAIAKTIGEFPPDQAARQLIERAKTAGARDNVSLILVGAGRGGTRSGGDPTHVARPQQCLARLRSRAAGLGASVRSLRWTDIDPMRLLAGLASTWHGKRPHGRPAARDALILLAWLLLALAVGLALGFLLTG